MSAAKAGRLTHGQKGRPCGSCGSDKTDPHAPLFKRACVCVSMGACSGEVRLWR
jgi:hypothetical protein